MIKLKYLCKSFTTPIIQGDLETEKKDGLFPVYGASGLAGYNKAYAAEDSYLGIVKDGAGVGRISKYHGKSSLLGTLAYIVPNEKADIDWLKYAIDSMNLSEKIDSTTIPHIYFSEYGNRYVQDIDIAKQKRIASFLDSQCAHIDTVIEKTKVSIEEYKKLKQAVITQAVTKGVRGDRPMKDSGSVWFGNIPSAWEMKKLKYQFRIKKDIAGEEGYTVLSITQKGIKPKDLSKNEGQLAESYANYQLVSVGDYAMNHMDLLTGWVDISQYDGVTSPDYRVFVLNDKDNNDSLYYLYMMQMCYSNRIFYGLGQGVSGLGRWRLQADKFLNFEIAVPTYEEQVEIAKYLNEKLTGMDKLIEKKEAFLQELEIYKKSLIYEYVTGKKEVPVS